MGPRPSPKHSIDRINNDLGYSKENCRWATMTEQNRNKSDNHFLTWNGITQTVTAWAEQLGISHSTLYLRSTKGWSDEKVLTTPVNGYDVKYELNGVNKPVVEWAKELGLSKTLIWDRLSKGMSFEDAVKIPVNGHFKYYEFNGKKQTLEEWGREYDIPGKTLHYRINKVHWPMEKALTFPVNKLSKPRKSKLKIQNTCEGTLDSSQVEDFPRIIEFLPTDSSTGFSRLAA